MDSLSGFCSNLQFSLTLLGIGNKLSRSPPDLCKAPGALHRGILDCIECKQQGKQKTGICTGGNCLRFGRWQYGQVKEQVAGLG